MVKIKQLSIFLTNQKGRLYNVLKSNEEGLLIGLPDPFTLKNECLNKLKNKTKKFLLKYIEKNKFKLMFLNTDKIYYSSFISRFYNPYKDNPCCPCPA